MNQKSLDKKKMKQYFLANRATYPNKKKAELAATNRMLNGDNLKDVRLFEVVKAYKPVIKFIEEK